MAEAAEVRIVNVVVAEVVVGVIMMDDGAKAQLTAVGSDPHEKLTVPV
jgi:hypothetical protein